MNLDILEVDSNSGQNAGQDDQTAIKNGELNEIQLEEDEPDEPCCTKKTKRQLFSFCLLAIILIAFIISSIVPEEER